MRRFPRKKALKNLIAFDSVRSRENNSSQYSSLFAMVKLGNRNRCIFEQREYRMEFHQCFVENISNSKLGSGKLIAI